MPGRGPLRAGVGGGHLLESPWFSGIQPGGSREDQKGLGLERSRWTMGSKPEPEWRAATGRVPRRAQGTVVRLHPRPCPAQQGPRR